MSLILDALRKADTERRLGEVPSLDAQPITPPPMRRNKQRTGRYWIAGLALTMAILAAAGYTWTMLRARSPSPGAPLSAGASAPAAAQAPRVSPPLRAAAQAASAQDADTDPSNRQKPQRAQPAAWLSDTRDDGYGVQVRVTPGGSAAGLYTPDTLPQFIRAGLPPLTISGSIHSPRAADRIVIINGLVLRERGEVAPGLVLEEIRPASVVLNFKGYRFEQSL
jgi:general secretion pathway protein B